jgi:hypothetical protein
VGKGVGMEKKEFEGLTEIEIVKLVQKKKKKYCAIALHDLEEQVDDMTARLVKMVSNDSVGDEALSASIGNKTNELYKSARKIFLDNINSYTRGIFVVIGIDIEGLEDE